MLIFWAKFTSKGIIDQKQKKVDITIFKFCIFELVWVPNFSLNYDNSEFSDQIYSRSAFSV